MNFNIFCQMLDPLDDGHVVLEAKASGSGKKTTYDFPGIVAALLAPRCLAVYDRCDSVGESS
jgi:hypothetical protein